MNLGEVRIYHVSVDDADLVFVQETGVRTFLLEERLHFCMEFVAIYGMHT